MGFKEHSRCFTFFAAPAGLSKGRAFREHKNRTRRQHSVEVNQGFRCFLFEQTGTRFEELRSNPVPMCHSPGCLQAVNRGGGHTGKLKLPSSCRLVCLALLNVFASPLWRPASSQPREGRANERTAHSTTTGTGRHNRSQQAPLPERQSQQSSPKVRPLHRSRHSCSSSSIRSDNDLSALPRDLASRSSSALCYDPAT